MNYFKNLLDQLKGLWNGASTRGRVVFVAIAALSVVLISLVGLWSSRPEFVTLAKDLTPGQARELVTKLDAENIEYELGFSGSSILVPRNHWNQARLVAGELAEPSPTSAEDVEQSWADDPTTVTFKLLRRQEQALARTIMRQHNIEHAIVHISKSRDSVFVEQAADTKASVTLDVKRGAVLTREQVEAVRAIVANSVEGLDDANVTISDTRGNLFRGSGDSSHAGITSLLDHQRQIEATRAANAEMMLAKHFGFGHAVVRVTADINLHERTTEEITYSQDDKVKMKEDLITKESREQKPQGAAGVTANSGGNSGRQQSDIITKDETVTTEYIPSQVNYKTTEPGGEIKRLTVAVMVDLSQLPEDADVATVKTGIENIVKMAVGFDESRNDTIAVMEGQFLGVIPLDESDVLEAEKWSNYSELARNASLGIAALVALVVGLLIVRRLKPQPPAEPTRDAASGRDKFLERFSSEVRGNPELVSRILANWLGDESAGSPATSGEHQDPNEHTRQAA